MMFSCQRELLNAAFWYNLKDYRYAMKEKETSWENFLNKPEGINQEMMDGFRYLIQNRSIIVQGNEFFIYRKLYAYYPNLEHYWRKCAWTYLKEKNLNLADSVASFIDTETGELLDSFRLT